MRILCSDEYSEMTILDALSNTDVLFYYEMPSTTLREKFQNECVKRKGNDFKVGDLPKIRLKYGRMILRGFRPGDFGKKVNGKAVPLSSEPGLEGFQYDPDWKNTVCKDAGYLVSQFAMTVFENPSKVMAQEELDDQADESDETEASDSDEDVGNDAEKN